LRVVLKVTALSAVRSASAYSKSISCWPVATSWWAVSTRIPKSSSEFIISLRTSVPRSSERSKYPAASWGRGSTTPLSRLRRKNSSSGPVLRTNPLSFRRASWRFRTPRGSPGKGSPFGVKTSQMTRADPVCSFSLPSVPMPGSHGIALKVSRSGTRNMSDSAMRAKPSMLEPSNHLPRSTASSSWCIGTWTDFTWPTMSVNWRLTKRRLRSSASFRAAASLLGATGVLRTG
jgi:hypothetical protein